LAWFTLCAVLAGSPAEAWTDTGHMIVAAIAYDQLTPAARAEANRLVRLNPDYRMWIAGASGRERDEVAFVTAATWPDSIKSKYGYMDDRNKPWGVSYSPNVGYADKIQHRYWHGVFIPFSADGTLAKMPNVRNALTQIAMFRAALRSPDASDDVKSYDLIWLLHIIGDLHQPLHAIARFTRADPEGDRWGNTETVCASASGGQCMILHHYWDTLLGDGYSAEEAIQAAAGIGRAPEPGASIADEVTWASESFEAAKIYAYAQPVGLGHGPFVLDQAYEAAAHTIARQRAALAGTRLANLLNAALR
jgi:hypothetical protein